jgi:hypothetical protein
MAQLKSQALAHNAERALSLCRFAACSSHTAAISLAPHSKASPKAQTPAVFGRRLHFQFPLVHRVDSCKFKSIRQGSLAIELHGAFEIGNQT